jgi:hypothetical protein
MVNAQDILIGYARSIASADEQSRGVGTRRVPPRLLSEQTLRAWGSAKVLELRRITHATLSRVQTQLFRQEYADQFQRARTARTAQWVEATALRVALKPALGHRSDPPLSVADQPILAGAVIERERQGCQHQSDEGGQPNAALTAAQCDGATLEERAATLGRDAAHIHRKYLKTSLVGAIVTKSAHAAWAADVKSHGADPRVDNLCTKVNVEERFVLAYGQGYASEWQRQTGKALR